MSVGREVQNCKLKKLSVFQDNFCLSDGHIILLRGSQACLIGTLNFALCRDGVLAEFFGGRFSVAFAVLTAEKYTPKIRGKFLWKNSMKTFRFLECFSVRFSVRCSVCFSVSSLLRQVLPRHTHTESVLKERSLKQMRIPAFPLPL